MAKSTDHTVAVLGASGYVGNRLVQKLLCAGYKVHAAARSVDRLRRFSWSSHPSITLIEFEALDQESVERVLNVSTHAFYLVHSLDQVKGDFSERDRIAAQNVVAASKNCSTQQLIYLGALGEGWHTCSEHLLSRFEVGEILKGANFPTTILRAAMIIGSGNVSFEMLRYVTERCPLILSTESSDTLSQPIAMSNLLHYLLFCIDNDQVMGKSFDLGGPDIVSYEDMVNSYAQQAKLPRRKLMQIPAENIELAASVLSVITPIPKPLIRSLIPSAKTNMICKDHAIKHICPQHLISIDEAMRRAGDRTQKEPLDWDQDKGERCDEWSDQNESSWSGGKLFSESKKQVIKGDASDIWLALKEIGGTQGWYGTDWLWELRGCLDSLLGGIGTRHGRTDKNNLVKGHQIDSWRIRSVEREKLLVLKSEMSLPGDAWLEYRLKELPGNRCEIKQTVMFAPRGLSGEVYWHAVKPAHELVFAKMLQGLVKASRCPIAPWTPWTALQDLFATANHANESKSVPV